MLIKQSTKVCYICLQLKFHAYKLVKKNRINIFLLAILHIALLLNPIILKSAHRHNSPIQQNSIQLSTSIDKQQKDCPICKFEFVNLIVISPLKYTALLAPNKINFPVTTFHVVPQPFCYFQHRAPPAWVF